MLGQLLQMALLLRASTGFCDCRFDHHLLVLLLKALLFHRQYPWLLLLFRSLLVARRCGFWVKVEGCRGLWMEIEECRGSG